MHANFISSLWTPQVSAVNVVLCERAPAGDDEVPNASGAAGAPGSSCVLEADAVSRVGFALEVRPKHVIQG